MKSLALVIFFVFSDVRNSAGKTKLNSLTTICSLSDPDVEECARKAATQLIPSLVKGIRDYDVPPIDPLKIPFMELSQSDKPVGMKLNMTNTEHEGMRLMQFKSIKLNDLAKKNYYEVVILFPRYAITGTCDFGGKILLLPIVGHGPCNLTAINMDAKLKITLEEEVRDGVRYYKHKDFKTELTYRDGAFKIEGLFDGNKELANTMNTFLNVNALDVLNEMKPTLEPIWNELFKGLMDRIAHSIPLDEFFKP